MEDVANEANNKLKPLKYPGLGLFMTFKIIFEIIVYIIQCTWRGVLFVFKDIPIMIWQRLSGKVDEAYRGTQAALQKEAKPQEATAPKKSVLNMDLNDLLKNTSFMKKKFEKLEKEKVKLLEELQISQSTLSHHMKILCESGIVTSYKDGKWTHYSLNPKGQEKAIEILKIITTQI